MEDKYTPRKATAAEIEEIRSAWLMEEGDPYPEYTAVFDDYVSDHPGYAGKVMLIVWPAGPELYEEYVWKKDGIERIKSQLFSNS